MGRLKDTEEDTSLLYICNRVSCNIKGNVFLISASLRSTHALTPRHRAHTELREPILRMMRMIPMTSQVAKCDEAYHQILLRQRRGRRPARRYGAALPLQTQTAPAQLAAALRT